MSEATTTSNADYFHLPRPLWRKLKKYLPKQNQKKSQGGRPRASDRAVANAQIDTCCGRDASGRRSTKTTRGLLQCRSRTFLEVEADGPLREADEEDGRVLRH
jgi:hypothetical protein